MGNYLGSEFVLEVVVVHTVAQFCRELEKTADLLWRRLWSSKQGASYGSGLAHDVGAR
jgi:hypothetical protein